MINFLGPKISPPKHFWVDVFPFPKVGYVTTPKPNIDNCTSTMNADVFPIEIMKDFPASHVSFQGCNGVTVCFQEDMLPFETQVLQSWYQLRSSLFGPVTWRISGVEGEIPPKFVSLWKIIEHRNINILLCLKQGDVQRIFGVTFGPFFDYPERQPKEGILYSYIVILSTTHPLATAVRKNPSMWNWSSWLRSETHLP